MNKTIIIVGLCFVAIVFGAYKLGRIQVSDKIENSVFNSVYIPPTATPTNTPSPTPTPISENDVKWEKVKENISKKGLTLTEYKENVLYEIREMVSCDRKLILCLEGCRQEYSQFLDYRGEYYFVVDFDIFNISSIDFENSLSNFTLVDNDEGYSYNPAYTFQGKGDIQGVVKSNDFRRAEVAFIVPYDPKNYTQYVLKFKTPRQEVKFFPYKN